MAMLDQRIDQQGTNKGSTGAFYSYRNNMKFSTNTCFEQTRNISKHKHKHKTHNQSVFGDWDILGLHFRQP